MTGFSRRYHSKIQSSLFGKALFLAATALAFGLGALRYPLGHLSHAGPGLFPFLVSSVLLGIAILTFVQSLFVKSDRLTLNIRNIGLILIGLGSFVFCSKLLNMTVGVISLVFITAAAGPSYSWKRNLQICAVLLAIAFVFQKLLGLNLPLI